MNTFFILPGSKKAKYITMGMGIVIGILHGAPVAVHWKFGYPLIALLWAVMGLLSSMVYTDDTGYLMVDILVKRLSFSKLILTIYVMVLLGWNYVLITM